MIFRNILYGSGYDMSTCIHSPHPSATAYSSKPCSYKIVSGRLWLLKNCPMERMKFPNSQNVVLGNYNNYIHSKVHLIEINVNYYMPTI